MARFRGSGTRPRWRTALRFAGVVLAAVVVVVCAYSYSETYRVEVKEYTFASPDVPAAFDGTRVVFLTDIHRAFYYSDSRVASIVDRANALEPDLIVLGGDYVYGSKDYEKDVFAELGHLKAPLGVFAVLGNHDYAHPGDGISDPEPTVTAAAEVGIPVLDNSGLWLQKSGQRIRLVGVSDLSEGHPALSPGLRDARPSDLVILLSHQPDFVAGLPRGLVDLTLSGHTHGGQMTFFGLWAPLTASEYGYRTGMIETPATTLIVSNGTGTIFPPLRFFARQQIVVVTLHTAA